MHYILGLVLILTSVIASAEDVEVRSYPLPKHGTLELKVLESWKGSVAQPPRELPPTIKFSAKTGESFTVLVTPIWLANPDIKQPTQDQLRANVRQSADIALLQSVEESIEIKEIKGPSNQGYYFSATDRMPKAGEFKYLNRGVIVVDNLLVSFTILTNDGQDAIVNDALSLLSSAEHH